MWAHQKTSDPYLGAILLAQRINTRCGGAVVAPWDVDKLSDDWLDALIGIDKWLNPFD